MRRQFSLAMCAPLLAMIVSGAFSVSAFPQSEGRSEDRSGPLHGNHPAFRQLALTLF